MWNRTKQGTVGLRVASVNETGLRRHIAAVTAYLAASFAVTALIAAATGFALRPAVGQNTSWWIAVTVTPLIFAIAVAVYRRQRRERLFSTRDCATTLRLLYLFAGLIGATAAAAFISAPCGAAARVFLAVALAFAAASIWSRLVRREFSPLVERLIVVELVLIGGLVFAHIIEIIVWPDGIEYLKYALNLRETLPDDATSGAMEWVASLAVLSYFSLTLGVYARRLANPDFTGMNEDDMRFAAASGAYDIFVSVLGFPVALLQVGRIFSSLT